MQVRGRGVAAVQLAGSEGALRRQHDTLTASFDEHRLVARCVAGSREQPHPLGDLGVAGDEPQPILLDRSPLRHRVHRRPRHLELGGLDIDGSVEHGLLTAVVEVEVGEDHACEVGWCELDVGKGISQRGGPRAVPRVDDRVAQP